LKNYNNKCKMKNKYLTKKLKEFKKSIKINWTKLTLKLNKSMLWLKRLAQKMIKLVFYKII
jgi:hypothetical protein